jgi:hypothetical protein
MGSSGDLDHSPEIAKHSAKLLAEHAHKALMAGWAAADVEERWKAAGMDRASFATRCEPIENLVVRHKVSLECSELQWTDGKHALVRSCSNRELRLYRVDELIMPDDNSGAPETITIHGSGHFHADGKGGFK